MALLQRLDGGLAEISKLAINGQQILDKPVTKMTDRNLRDINEIFNEIRRVASNLRFGPPDL